MATWRGREQSLRLFYADSLREVSDDVVDGAEVNFLDWLYHNPEQLDSEEYVDSDARIVFHPQGNGSYLVSREERP